MSQWMTRRRFWNLRRRDDCSAFNLADARKVTSTLEWSHQPNLDDAQGELARNHALAKGEHVGVVVLAVEAG